MVVPLCRLAFCHVPSRQPGEVTCQQWLSMSGHPLPSVNDPLVFCGSSSPKVLRLEQDLNLLEAPDDRLLGLVALGLVAWVEPMLAPPTELQAILMVWSGLPFYCHSQLRVGQFHENSSLGMLVGGLCPHSLALLSLTTTHWTA